MNREIYQCERVREKTVRSESACMICQLSSLGAPVQLTPAEKKAAEQTILEFGFNMVASDKISMDRRIKDTRPAEY